MCRSISTVPYFALERVDSGFEGRKNAILLVRTALSRVVVLLLSRNYQVRRRCWNFVHTFEPHSIAQAALGSPPVALHSKSELSS
jgi:hypothetical protein